MDESCFEVQAPAWEAGRIVLEVTVNGVALEGRAWEGSLKKRRLLSCGRPIGTRRSVAAGSVASICVSRNAMQSRPGAGRPPRHGGPPGCPPPPLLAGDGSRILAAGSHRAAGLHGRDS